MAKALIASWRFIEGDDISVTIRNLTADELCSFQMQFSDNLSDLEAKLVDPKGQLFEHICSPIMNFYAASDPFKHLALHVCVRELDAEFYIKQADVGICLEKWPYVGKFLEAMQHNKFDPRSDSFDVTWTAKTAPKVAPRKALALVAEVLHGWPSHMESECRFVQIFGKLVTLIEPWENFNLEHLQQSVHMKYFKRVVCQHFVEIACSAATSMLSHDGSLPILMHYEQENGRDVAFVVGHNFPAQFNDPAPLPFELRLSGIRPSFEWRYIAQALLFLDWDFQTEYLDIFQAAARLDCKALLDFQTFQPAEILQMVHLQVRLSCCRVAEVAGPINEACVRVLAELLEYKLKILKFQPDTDLHGEIQSFEDEMEHFGAAEYRGSLVLLIGLPATFKGNMFSGYHHRMILCYQVETELP
eukprot:Skav204908  [mRNA]  locus=scaffold1926:363202:364449:+ [translate_table: standard]